MRSCNSRQKSAARGKGKNRKLPRTCEKPEAEEASACVNTFPSPSRTEFT